MLAFLVMFEVQQEHMVSVRIKLRIGNWFVFAHSNESISACTTISWLINCNFQIGGHFNGLAASRRALLVCLGAHARVLLPEIVLFQVLLTVVPDNCHCHGNGTQSWNASLPPPRAH